MFSEKDFRVRQHEVFVPLCSLTSLPYVRTRRINYVDLGRLCVGGLF